MSILEIYVVYTNAQRHLLSIKRSILTIWLNLVVFLWYIKPNEILMLNPVLYIYIWCNLMCSKTWLSRHYRFISAENITILSVSSDDFFHVFHEVAEQQMWNYNSHLKNKNKKVKNKKKWEYKLFKFTGEGRGGSKCLWRLDVIWSWWIHFSWSFHMRKQHFRIAIT